MNSTEELVYHQLEMMISKLKMLDAKYDDDDLKDLLIIALSLKIEVKELIR